MEGFTYHYFPGFSDPYVEPRLLNDALTAFKDVAVMRHVGNSVDGLPIFGLEVGTGEIRVLMWSQMHGNESTTTRGLLDILFAQLKDETVQKLLSGFTLFLIPMLNPDGARAYTRNNARDIDLNRDAQDRSQPETQALFQVFEAFKPHYCFNLHDQRSRYGVYDPPIPATLSFLAPAADSERSITPARQQAMAILGKLHALLRVNYSIGVGRYDDTYNPNCVGDAITAFEVPTFLVEAGFYPGDYARERTRKYIYFTVLATLKIISESAYAANDADAYLDIPENNSCFVDIHIKNAFPNGSETERDLYLNYKEQIDGGAVQFIPEQLEEHYASDYIGHLVYDWNDPEDKKHIRSDQDLKQFFE